MRICEREPRDKRAGIVPALLQRDYYCNESARGPYIDVGMARRVAKALNEAGIRPSPRQRHVGDYVLKELIEENSFFAYQDFQAVHSTTRVMRRVRLYTVSGKDKATHECVRRAALQKFWILKSLETNGNMAVHLENGRRITWNLKEHNYVDHAYAMTSHSSQDMTVDRVLIHVDTNDYRVRGWLTKHSLMWPLREPVTTHKFFVDRASQLGQSLSREIEKDTALSPQQIENHAAQFAIS